MIEDMLDELDYEDISVLFLVDENGKKIRLELLDCIAYQGSEYAVMIPPAADEDSDEPTDVIILKVEMNDDGTKDYNFVDDENVLNGVFAIFKQRFGDSFDFE